MQSATNPWALFTWVDVFHSSTAGWISWHDAQNWGVDVRTMVKYVILKIGNAIIIPMVTNIMFLRYFWLNLLVSSFSEVSLMADMIKRNLFNIFTINE